MIAECVLEICDAPADAGPWCHAHWEELLTRDVDIENGTRSAESAAREIVVLRRQLDFLAEFTGTRFTLCRCGHMVIVHSHGGCHGLRARGFDEYERSWAPCWCERFEVAS